MSRTTLSLTILSMLLIAAACPPDDIIFPEPDESTSSTTSKDASTGMVTTSGGGIGFDCKPIPQVAETRGGLATSCALHPWADACQTTPVTCEDVVVAMLDAPACATLDWCDYVACADAMADSECGVRPAACDELISCINAG